MILLKNIISNHLEQALYCRREIFDNMVLFVPPKRIVSSLILRMILLQKSTILLIKQKKYKKVLAIIFFLPYKLFVDGTYRRHLVVCARHSSSAQNRRYWGVAKW